jgi:hypothetical protein
MVKMYKTKKIKYQPKKKTKKLYRGGKSQLNDTQETVPNASSEAMKENQIMEEVKNSSSLSSLMPNLNVSNIMGNIEGPISKIKQGAVNIVGDSVVLAEGLAEKGIEKLGDAVGVDVTHPETIEKKLHQFKNIISNPEIRQELANIGEVALESASPYIEPLKDKIIEKTQEVGKELGESAVKIGLNTVEEIPGVGIIIGTLRSLDQATKAGLSTVGAVSEVVKDTSDAINATAKNYKRLIGEKLEIGNRINNSISEFTNPQNLLSKKNLLKVNPLKTKGGSNKKIYNKSKKHTNKNKNKYKYK